MSGLKYSRIEIAREQKARQKAFRKISLLISSINELRRKVKIICDAFPQGVKKSFSDEFKRVESWQIKKMPEVSKKMKSTKLNSIVRTLKRIDNEGKKALSILIEIKEVKRDKKAKELIKSEENLKAALAGMREILDKWRPGEYEKLTKEIDSLYQIIETGEFAKVADMLNELKNETEKFYQECASLEEQDIQRRYVLESLREVCKEMGWGEIKGPILEEEGNYKSPLLYEVQTYSAGNMIFRLTLEGIKVHSPITKDTCYKDFNELSEKLKRFGVTTKFEGLQAPEEEPKLIQKGELDLPDEGMERETET